MSTDGDKITAGTLAAALWPARSKSTNPLDNQRELVALYGEVLVQVTRINPDTGKPFRPDEIQRVRLRAAQGRG
ncbi:MAG: hypothetical protein WA459_19425 [Stellaceae bacterium]